MAKVNDKNENVIVFVYYDCENDYLDESVEKEKNVIKYCEDKKYNVIEIKRKVQYYYENLVIKDIAWLLESVRVYNILNDDIHITKVVIYDIEELGRKDFSISTIAGMFEMCDISLETIKQGIIGKDYRCGGYKEIINYVNNEKYFIKELPF